MCYKIKEMQSLSVFLSYHCLRLNEKKLLLVINDKSNVAEIIKSVYYINYYTALHCIEL